MLILLIGTGIFLTVRTRFLTWRNLGYALKSTLSKEARTKSRGQGDVSPFSALTTALAATIGTGNIVGVATAIVSGGPGALVWNFSDIANALMAIPNLICMLLLSGEIAKDVKEFQPEIKNSYSHHSFYHPEVKCSQNLVPSGSGCILQKSCTPGTNKHLLY